MMLMKMVEMGRRADAAADDIDGFPASLPRASGLGTPTSFSHSLMILQATTLGLQD